MALKDGLVGKAIVGYFQNNYGTEAVDAVPYRSAKKSPAIGQMDYTITFKHGTAQTYRFTFGQNFPDIVDVTPLN